MLTPGATITLGIPHTTRLGRGAKGWATEKKSVCLVVVSIFLVIFPDTFNDFWRYHHLRRYVLGVFFSVARSTAKLLGGRAGGSLKASGRTTDWLGWALSVDWGRPGGATLRFGVEPAECFLVLPK